MSFKLPLGPTIRNFNFRLVTRQLKNENVLAKIEGRSPRKCIYNDEKLDNTHLYATCPLSQWIFELIYRNNLYTFAITDDTIETTHLGRHITKNYMKKVQVKGKAKFLQAAYAVARFTISNIHNKNIYLDSRQTKTLLINTFKKFQRESITEEVNLFCENIHKIPMNNFPNPKTNKNKYIISKDQLDYYKQQTIEADYFFNEFETKNPQQDQPYTLKELKQFRAALYHIYDKDPIAKDLILKDMEADLNIAKQN